MAVLKGAGRGAEREREREIEKKIHRGEDEGRKQDKYCEILVQYSYEGLDGKARPQLHLQWTVMLIRK